MISFQIFFKKWERMVLKSINDNDNDNDNLLIMVGGR